VTQALILPAYTAKRLNVSGRAYLLGGYLGPLAAALPYAATLWVVARQWPAQHLPALALQIACCLMVFVAFAYLLAFNRAERQQWFGRFSSSGRLAKAL
jgi:hypothetical protein